MCVCARPTVSGQPPIVLAGSPQSGLPGVAIAATENHSPAALGPGEGRASWEAGGAGPLAVELAGAHAPCRRTLNRCCALKIHNPGLFQVSGKPRTQRGFNTSRQRGAGLAQPMSPSPGVALGPGPGGWHLLKGSHIGGPYPHHLIPSHPRPPPCLCSAA